MGQKDLSEKNLEYFPDVFADIVNALLYEGEMLLDPADLAPAPTETMYYSQSGKLRNQFNDVSKYQMKDGSIHLQYTLENETKANRKMIFRRIGYEGAIYREQLERKENYPFVGLILYWGRKKWRHPRSVAEFFSERELSLDIWKYINNFHMQVFQMAHLPKKVRSRFTSDMRIIVDYLAEGKNYTPSGQPIVHMEAFLLLMKNLSGDDRYEEIIESVLAQTSKGDKITMCELLDRYINKGISQGISQGESRMLVQSVDNLITNLSLSLNQACESIGSSIDEYRKAQSIIASTLPENR